MDGKRDRWASSGSEGEGGKKERRKKNKKKRRRGGDAADAAAVEHPAPPAVADARAGAGAGAAEVAPVVDDGVARVQTGSGVHIPLVHGCRNVDCYKRLNHIDEGSYGVVFRAQDKETGGIYAIKQVKLEASSALEGFPITALRETNLLMSLRHPNIVRVREMVVGSSVDKVYMVMEYMEHDLRMYLNAVMEHYKEPLSQAEVKCLMHQLLSATAYMHSHWVLHRDIKSTNVLIDHSGRICVCDFGLARLIGAPIRRYTNGVITRWYRPPELLLEAAVYGPEVDVWGLGALFIELLINEPAFTGETEAETLDRIFFLLGSPTTATWPGYTDLPMSSCFQWKTYPRGRLRKHLNIPDRPFAGKVWLSEVGMDLMLKLLACDPKQRITAAEALEHPWFSEAPKPAKPEDLPKFPSTNEGTTPAAATPDAAWAGVFRAAPGETK